MLKTMEQLPGIVLTIPAGVELHCFKEDSKDGDTLNGLDNSFTAYITEILEDEESVASITTMGVPGRVDLEDIEIGVCMECLVALCKFNDIEIEGV